MAVAPGNNEIRFNEATMIRAIQHYLDTVMLREKHGVEVVSVARNSDGHSSTFIVKTTEVESAD